MPLRLALFALAVSLWGCGDDSDPPPTAAADSLLAPEAAVVRPIGALHPWDLSPIVPLVSVRTMPAGTQAFMRTEFAHGELADLEMTFVQVVDDFLPPMPVYMLEASDPVLIQLEGIAQGMSGSPIFTEQGTWGAIAYGFYAQDSPPYYFFATPIEWVIGTRGTVPAAKPTAMWEGNRIIPLETPLLSTGLNRMHPLPQGNSSLLSRAVSAGLTQERQASFEAGRPLAVGLLLGELTLGPMGTISYVDGNRIYGFGHPMFGTGPVKLPIIEAKVLGEISNWFAPFKFATLNPTVRGTLTEDRLPGVRGVLDEEPALVPVKSVYAFPSGSTVELAHQMAVGIDPYISLDLVSSALSFPLINRVENYPDHSIHVATDISFVGIDSTLTRSRLYSSPGAGLYSLINTASCELSHILSKLVMRNDYALQMHTVEAHIELIPEPRFAIITEVATDTVVNLGNALTITASLRVGRRMDREVKLALSVPDTLSAGKYQLKVGSAAKLAGASDEEEDACREESFFGPSPPSDDFGDQEPLNDIFARANKPDEHVLLEARLIRPISAGGGFTSTQEDVGLLLKGVHNFWLEVVEGDS